MRNHIILFGVILITSFLISCEAPLSHESLWKIHGMRIEPQIIQNDTSKNLTVTMRLPVERDNNVITIPTDKGTGAKGLLSNIKFQPFLLNIVDSTGRYQEPFKDYHIIEGNLANPYAKHKDFSFDSGKNEYVTTFTLKMLKKGVYGIIYSGGTANVIKLGDNRYTFYKVLGDFQSKSRNQQLMSRIKYEFRKDVSDKTPPLTEPVGWGAYYLFEIK